MIRYCGGVEGRRKVCWSKTSANGNLASGARPVADKKYDHHHHHYDHHVHPHCHHCHRHEDDEDNDDNRR